MEYVVEVDDALTNELLKSIEAGEILEFTPEGNSTVKFEKRLVERTNNLKIEVFSNEHPPPHFRVKYQGSTANFTISDCSCINGDEAIIKFKKNIFKWWKKNKSKIIDAWDSSRPSDCPVGEYRG